MDDDNRYCIGCGRTMAEISGMGDAELARQQAEAAAAAAPPGTQPIPAEQAYGDE